MSHGFNKSELHRFESGDTVAHPRFGIGTVELDRGTTVLVRFQHGYESLERTVLVARLGLIQAIECDRWSAPLDVIARCQAAAIQSVNDSWGVFSRSRIALLPHQLWVCHQVLRQWPIRFMVADDVGLGKTIEAGLILWPLLSKGLVKRFLVLCPAALVEQWQFRLREMFDIRLARYLTEADTARADFWSTHPQVVASLPTLRTDRNGRHERLLEAESWDLLIIDEAHHLNADEASGATLGYHLVQSLLERKKFESCIFFTGTPHRGKPFGFWSLMTLLRPDLFDPRKPEGEQIPRLREALIRNNKQSVTDMQGKTLFQPVTVYPETYCYSPAERDFYALLTDFIASGRAYANSLSAQGGRQVMLVLIAMQKLASSSVAAIRSALKGRLNRLKATRDDLQAKLKLSDDEVRALSSEQDDWAMLLDQQQTVDDLLARATVTLMSEEIPNLEALVAAADHVQIETKIEKILALINTRFVDRQVLFFTEYKATQSLLMSALIRVYGPDCATFINGDDRIENLALSDERVVSKSLPRAYAADLFNSACVRFLVSTEAGGEGIDLQKCCHLLIHVDLPWNPMRLHQRVGRLNRYGQKSPVEVITIRNPETVESRIWDKLNLKLARIMEALGGAMDEPEDLLQLVLGMSSSGIFSEIFSEGQFVSPDRLDRWFDNKAETFGGQSAIETVKGLVGHAARFDLSGLKDIPDLDLPDLKPFFTYMLERNGRRPVFEGEHLSFKTPDSWLGDVGVRRRYEGLVFSREEGGKTAAEKVIGVGHKAFDHALSQALETEASIALITGLPGPIVVFAVYDEVTDQSGHVREVVVGVRGQSNEEKADLVVMKDWILLKQLNETAMKGKNLITGTKPGNSDAKALVSVASEILQGQLQTLNLPFRFPVFRPIALLVPG